MFGKTRSSFVVVDTNLGPQCLYSLLSLLRLIFKAYKDLTPFIFFFHMYLLHEQKRNLLSESCSGYYWWIF